MWACDLFCVPTVLFQTLCVFFVIRLANREILHVEVTRHPTADWAAQQIVECCAWDRAPPRFLIHDRDSRYGASFDRRVRGGLILHKLSDTPRRDSRLRFIRNLFIEIVEEAKRRRGVNERRRKTQQF
jgi:hypothetical protein